MYWRQKPINTLSPSTFTPRVLQDVELGFPYPADPFLACLYVDAAHATCLTTRRSMAAHLVVLGGTAVAYQSKLQAVVATSSTEAKFMAAVNGGKSLLSVRLILKELGFPQNGPAPVFEDNAAAIMNANKNKPTDRTRHIDIQLFAIQQWVERGDMKLQHIPGTLNPSDTGTKTLAAKLFQRHTTRSMGQLGSPYTEGTYKIPFTSKATDE